MNMMSFESCIIFFIAILGLCLGSFYNVVILRSLNGESIVFPPSKCPNCGTKLKPWHNIPIISYLCLRGKCAFCKEKISIQYPIIEFVTALIFVSIFLKFGMSYTSLFAILWASFLIIMTVTDFRAKIVDCNLAIVMGVSGVIYSFLNYGWLGAKNSILGAILGVVVIESIALLGHLFKKGRAMGEADTYVVSAFGAIAGWQSLCLILLYSLLASMIFTLPKFWVEKYKHKDSITIFFSALFLFCISFVFLYNYALWTVILLIISGLCLILRIIYSMKESDIHYLPFVPSLALGFLYFLIFVL